MPLISKRTVHAVHDLSIVQVIDSYNIGLKRSGSSFKCCCPFHNERSPSFSVHPGRNIYKCFSCGKGGDPVKFVMDFDGLNYHDAILRLANCNNITIEYEDDKRTEADLKAEKDREAMRIALDTVQEFFVEQFKADSDEANAAREYAHSRWGEEFCDLFGIGYAPKGKALIDYITRRGLSLDVLKEVGIIAYNEERGDYYATLRERVTLPVRSRSRTLLTFSARYIGTNPDILKSKKYLNLKDSLLFSKSNTLFGIDVANRAAREAKNFVMVEGGPDVLRLQIIGVNQAVATLGTALTSKHLDLLKNTCRTLIFIPDSDAPKPGASFGAGINAVLKNGKLAIQQGFDVKVKEIPRTADDDENEVKKDADSFITSKEIYDNLDTVPFLVWYAKKRLGKNPSSDLTAEVINEVAELVLEYKNEILRELYIEELSNLFGNKKLLAKAMTRITNKIKEEFHSKSDTDGLPQNIVASLYRVGLVVKSGCYLGADNGKELQRWSNFIFLPVLHLKNAKGSTLILKVVNTFGEEEVVELKSSDLVNNRHFKSRLFDRGNYLWYGDEKNLNTLLDHVLEVTHSASLIDVLGYNTLEDFYAFSNGIYVNGAFIKADDIGVVNNGNSHYFLPGFSKLNSKDTLSHSFERLFCCNPQGMTTLREFAGQIVKVYGKGGIVSFAWTLAAIFRDIIFDRLKYFPVLNLFGRKGSGKTELARALSSMFYTLPSTPNSCSNTSIPVIGYNLSHVKNSVLILDEYTNDLMPQRIDLLKGLWGGTARSKMDGENPVTIPVLSGVILAGQYKPEDEAIFSRCIHLMYSQTSFSREEKQNFKELSEMVLHGNTHLLLPILKLRNVFEEGFYKAFELTINDVMIKLENEKVEDRILHNWVVALTAFRVLEPHIDVPFSYAEVFDTVVEGIRYQNDQIRKSSDTANFWQFIDTMHSQGKVKEKCHFVIKSLTSFTPMGKNEPRSYIEPKRIIFLNFKAVRGLLEQRIQRQKYGSTLDIATIESYLKSLPQFLGIKQQRFQILRTNGELEEEFKTEGTQSKKVLPTNPAYALCFDYDSLKAMLELNLETIRISEAEFEADFAEAETAVEEATAPLQRPEEPELPF